MNERKDLEFLHSVFSETIDHIGEALVGNLIRNIQLKSALSSSHLPDGPKPSP
ncbi:MAG: hypothetical protein ACON38_18155 [Akkermansiaceae bacterium]